QRVCLSDSKASHISLKLGILVREHAHGVVKGLVRRRHCLRGARVHSRENFPLVRHGVLVIESSLNLIRGCKILVADGICEAVVAPHSTAVEHTHEDQRSEDPDEGVAATPVSITCSTN